MAIPLNRTGRPTSNGPITQDLYLYEDIGNSLFGGISSKQVVNDLAAFGRIDQLNVRINSAGGDVSEGLAIYNALRRYPANVTTYIDSAAWSIASIIAMAGSEVVMSDNAQLMIHDPRAMVFATADELRTIADTLDNSKDAMITAYQQHAKVSRRQLADWMDAETWFTAAEAKDAGFITRIESGLQMAAHYAPWQKFQNMPAWVKQRVKSGGSVPATGDRYRVALLRMGQRTEAVATKGSSK